MGERIDRILGFPGSPVCFCMTKPEVKTTPYVNTTSFIHYSPCLPRPCVWSADLSPAPQTPRASAIVMISSMVLLLLIICLRYVHGVIMYVIISIRIINIINVIIIVHIISVILLALSLISSVSLSLSYHYYYYYYYY